MRAWGRGGTGRSGPAIIAIQTKSTFQWLGFNFAYSLGRRLRIPALWSHRNRRRLLSIGPRPATKGKRRRPRGAAAVMMMMMVTTRSFFFSILFLVLLFFLGERGGGERDIRGERLEFYSEVDSIFPSSLSSSPLFLKKRRKREGHLHESSIRDIHPSSPSLSLTHTIYIYIFVSRIVFIG